MPNVFVLVVAVLVALGAGFGWPTCCSSAGQADDGPALWNSKPSKLSLRRKPRPREAARSQRGSGQDPHPPNRGREYRAQSQQIEKRLLQKEENLDRKGMNSTARE